MIENNLEGEQREPCKEAKFVDDKRAELIQRVTSVMPIADELKSKDMLHEEKYDEIRAKGTNQDKMRTLFESLKAGDMVKIAFYELLEKHELPLFKELGGVCRKRKLSDPESPVPYKRPNTDEQNNPNFNSSSTSAPRAPTNLTVTNIVNERPPPYNSIVLKTEWKPVKPPAPKKKKNPPVPKVKKPPAPKKEKKPPVPKVKKPPAPKKEKKPPVPKIKKPTVSKVKKPPAPKKNKPPVPKKEKKPTVPKVKKPPAPKKNKPPVPKIKKPPASKKEKKPAGRK